MNIFIPTIGRVHRQKTLKRLPILLRKKTTLVLDSKDYKLHSSEYEELKRKYKCQIAVMPAEVKRMAAIRKYIGQELADDTFVMLDDDLRFLQRKDNIHTRLYQMHGEDKEKIIDLFQLIKKALKKYAHVGVSDRTNNYTVPKSYTFNTRYTRILAFRKKEFLMCKHERVTVMEDFDTALQLLRLGYKSYIICDFAQDQDGGTQVKGGCSTYRTQQLQKEAALTLQRLHPQFVKVKEKKNKTGGEFGTRTDVMIFWNKAYKSSIQNPLFRN